MPSADRVADKVRPAASPRVAAVVPVLVSGAALAGIIPLVMMGDVVFMIAAAGLAVGILTMAILGLERSAIACLAMSFLFVPMDDLRPAAESFVALSDVFLVIGLLLLAPILIDRPFRYDGLLLVGVVAVLAVVLVGIAASQNVTDAITVAPRLVVGALVLPTVFMWWRPSSVTVPIFACAYVVGNVISVGYGLAGFGLLSVEGRIFGLSTHPNVVGLTSMLALALVLYLWSELPQLRWLILPAGLVSALGVWESGSRAALVVTVGIVAIYPVLTRSIEASLLLSAGALVGAFIVGQTLSIGLDNTNTLARLFGAGSASASDQVRALNAQNAIEEINENPFLGNGLSAATLETHNIYLQVAQAGGVALLVAFIVLLAAVVRRPFLIDPRFRLLALAGIAYVMVGPITPILWERYVWAVLALPFLVPLEKESEMTKPPIATRVRLLIQGAR